MYRRILVPVDGSDTSRAGLRQALGLAKGQGARVRVLNVVDERLVIPAMDGYPVADMGMLIASMREAGEKALTGAERLAARLDVRADTVLVESRGRAVSDLILDAAKKWRADLIVMGTHGRRGLNRLLLGSDAERVLRETPVPVMLIRAGEARRPVRRRRR
jgi:nucleotide-binding universal stress UspA family protein